MRSNCMLNCVTEFLRYISKLSDYATGGLTTSTSKQPQGHIKMEDMAEEHSTVYHHTNYEEEGALVGLLGPHIIGLWGREPGDAPRRRPLEVGVLGISAQYDTLAIRRFTSKTVSNNAAKIRCITRISYLARHMDSLKVMLPWNNRISWMQPLKNNHTDIHSQRALQNTNNMTALIHVSAHQE